SIIKVKNKQIEQVLDYSYPEIFVKTFIEDMEKQQELKYYTGGDFYHKTNRLNITFTSYKKRSLKNARKTLVACVEEYLHRLNTDEKIRPFLITYPTTYKDLDIGIVFFDESENWHKFNFLTNASLIQGTSY